MADHILNTVFEPPPLCVPEVVDDTRRAMIDFGDDFYPIVSSGCLS
jgi:hypothetical protein